MQRYQILSQNEIGQIHETSLRIMEEVGVIFSYAPAREILAKGGAKVDGQRVYFPKAMVEREIKKAPSSFTLYARNPEKNVLINTQKTAYVGPYGSPFVMDMDNGRRLAKLEDFINICKLEHKMDNIDIMSHIPCEPQDVDVEVRSLEMVYQTLKHSDKPLMATVLGYEMTKRNLEMAAIVFGGLEVIKEKPVAVGIPCTLTPLSYDDKMAGAIIAYAEYRQPQLVNSLCIAGATTPVTVAGTVALQNAEVLAGIVLAQLVSEGTPIIYSASSSNAEMSNGSLAIGTPEDAVFSLINGQLAKFYNLPCRISGALSDSKCADAQAAYESMLTLSMAQMAGGNFILHSAGIIDTYNTISLEKMMFDDEIIGMIRRIDQGVVVNEETLAFDVTKEVGPQGQFLTHVHTFNHFRKEFYRPILSDRNNPTQWEAEGSLTAEKRANARWKKLLEEYAEPVLDKDVDAALRKYKDK
ncbi:trimethylamine:corrinoid methyltransferase [Desulfosporosinus orientis DSM 765]|uniref:Methyltransferase n=1 Tax=Desulfosporosinus orientis (strain ATCC 19365 / DSM 765 / NCIMB 8382 / VKM B-1628 / Singapore I) TaxID=768706 RepID=G7WBC6_DESOD|nr:trimethylamine--corrinoid methyltransferase [Desulfosporosinus orientis]AET68255.1 trimethylamine:corrinoid methyltransferase [Desulfosporosinus orientis DSM 765]